MTPDQSSHDATAPFGSSDGAALHVFLIADVRGYTRFTQQHGDEAAARLAGRFAALAREMVEARGGEVIELRGDEALAVFVSPRQAIRAALELQERFAVDQERNPSLPLDVGMGLDAGEALPVEGGYRGGALNLAARLCSLAGPGEVFTTEALIHLTRKMDGIVSLDRGQVQLKGLSDPVRVIQVAREGAVLPDIPRFTVNPTPSNNLPPRPTSFVGRERELIAVSGMLRQRDVRLLTLTGPGGTGKTRMALQAAEEVLTAFADGVYFVSLASVADPELVAPTVAATLGLQEVGGETVLEMLESHLRDKTMLLLLDNFEHLLAADGLVAHLVGSCPSLKVMVTSRAVLHLASEHVYAVPPLALPDREPLLPVENLVACDAIALFVQRARAARATFALTEENAAAVVDVCHRLDGLPLAIELAAAWVRILTPRAMLARLEHRFQLLVGGARDLPARQQTLRAAIDWSFSLLDSEEQRLFARLAAFVGGFTLDAAETVCANLDEESCEALPIVVSLVDKSLLQPAEGPDGEPRFVMLETLREYALERLEVRAETDLVRRQHARYFLALAEQAESEVMGPDQATWLARLETEHDNLRATLKWALEEGDLEVGLLLVGALWRFWHARGYLTEGNRWVQSLLSADAREGSGPPSKRRRAARAKALLLAGAFTTNQGNYDQARGLTEESLALYRDLEDRWGTGVALNILGNVAYYHGEYDRAEGLYRESLTLRRELGNQRDIAISLNNLGNVVREQGDYDRAAALYGESLEIHRALGDEWNIAIVLDNLGHVARQQGRFDRAVALFEDSLAVRRRLRDVWGIAESLNGLGSVARDEGDVERAAALFAECLVLYRKVGDKWRCAECLEVLAWAARMQGRLERSARLFGAASAIRDSIGAPLSRTRKAEYEADLAAVRAGLGTDRFRAAWEEGRSMSLEEVADDVAPLAESGKFR